MSTNNEAQGISHVLGTNRIEAFSDGVFAVAITLLVLNLGVPQLAAKDIGSLPYEVFRLLPKFLSYILSFVVVGIYWVSHHNTFHYIKRSDRNLLWLNILLLLCIVFIPFPAALLGLYPDQQISIVIYGGTLVITGLVVQLLWWYASSGYRLVDKDIDPLLVQRATRRNLTGPLIYLLAIGISFFSPQLSLVFFVLVPLFYILPGRIDRHWAQRRKVDKTSPPSSEEDDTPSDSEIPV